MLSDFGIPPLPTTLLPTTSLPTTPHPTIPLQVTPSQPPHSLSNLTNTQPHIRTRNYSIPNGHMLQVPNRPTSSHTYTLPTTKFSIITPPSYQPSHSQPPNSKLPHSKSQHSQPSNFQPPAHTPNHPHTFSTTCKHSLSLNSQPPHSQVSNHPTQNRTYVRTPSHAIPTTTLSTIKLRGGFRGGVTGARPPPPPLNLAQLTDELLFFHHLAKIKWRTILLLIDYMQSYFH